MLAPELGFPGTYRVPAVSGQGKTEMPKITKRTVDALKPHGRERVVWDDDLKGFGVRVHPSGRKVFIVKTRFGGRVIKMTIGPCTAVSASNARVRAAEIITDARAGKNPTGRRSKALTMRVLGERFLAQYVANHCKPSTGKDYRHSIEMLINPGSATAGCRMFSGATSRPYITIYGTLPTRPIGHWRFCPR